jgi:hypothetical protein
MKELSISFLDLQLKILKMTTIGQIMLNLNKKSRKWVRRKNVNSINM